MTDRMVYHLGGVPSAGWITRGRVAAGVVCGGLLLAGIVWTSVSRTVWSVVVTTVAAVALWVLWRARDSAGSMWLVSMVANRLRPVVAGWAGWDTWDPTLTRKPFWLSDASVVAVSAPSGGEVGLFEQGGVFTAVLEVNGSGDGLLPAMEHNRLEAEFQTLLVALSQPGFPVSQVDLMTRAVPAPSHDLSEWMTARLAPGIPDQLAESMGALAAEAERLAEQLRTFVVIRMPTVDLARDARSRGVSSFDAETVPTAAMVTVGRVARLLTGHGLQVIRALSAEQTAALIRSLLCPSFAVDDTDAIPDDWWLAWPPFSPAADGRAVVARGPAGDQWWHATASVPFEGWPSIPTLGRWLEPVVFEANLLYRTVIVSLRLLDPYQASALAKSQLTTAESRRIKQYVAGQVSAGEAELGVKAAQLVAGDITTRGQAGIVPTVRVMVSASSPSRLNRDREAVDATMRQDLACSRVLWDDDRHTVGMLRCLPLGLEVQR